MWSPRCLCIPPPLAHSEFLNKSSHETGNVHHVARAHLNGILYKSVTLLSLLDNASENAFMCNNRRRCACLLFHVHTTNAESMVTHKERAWGKHEALFSSWYYWSLIFSFEIHIKLNVWSILQIIWPLLLTVTRKAWNEEHTHWEISPVLQGSSGAVKMTGW
jgi:hypothetical protein